MRNVIVSHRRRVNHAEYASTTTHRPIGLPRLLWLISFVLLWFLLAGCSHDDGGNTSAPIQAEENSDQNDPTSPVTPADPGENDPVAPTDPGNDDPVTPPAPENPVETNRTLRFASLDELAIYLQQANEPIYADDDLDREGDLANSGAAEMDSSPSFAEDGAVAAPATGSEVSSAERSDVNIQEFGVDEADIFRSDGKYIYAIEREQIVYAMDIARPAVMEGGDSAADVAEVDAVAANDQIGIALYDPDREDPCAATDSSGNSADCVSITAVDDVVTSEQGPGDSASAGSDGEAIAEPLPGGDTANAPPELAGDRVRIMAIGDPVTELESIGRFDPGQGEKAVALSGLYLPNNATELVMLGADRADPWHNWYDVAYWWQQETTVYFADVSNPTAPALTKTLTFQGGLVDSRVVDNTLYLMTRYYPPSVYTDGRDTAIDANTTGVVPGYRVDGQADYTAMVVDGCYVENVDSPRSGAMIAVIAVDLADPEHPQQTTCFVGEANTLYSSTNALYLAAEDYQYEVMPLTEMASGTSYEQRTLVHKFAFDGLDVRYRGTGVVPGYLADNPKEASFRFSEAGDRLRVVTEIPQPFDWFEPWPVFAEDDAAAIVTTEAAGSPVLVTILQDNGAGNDLEVIASLPNETRPEVIGLRGENLYASRFIGDYLYLVTFRTIDPLYVIDLTDPFDPKISGALKIEGFSDYLHPVADNLLLGIGKDAYPDENGHGESRGAWYQGLQIALFDVSDPANPMLWNDDRLIVGKRGTEAAVLHDHLAFAGMATENGYRFAFGVQLFDASNDPFNPREPWQYAGFTHHGLHRFEIDLGSRTITELPPLVTTEREWGGEISVSTWDDRALLIGESVHFYHDGLFWSQDWAGQLAAIGPQ